MLTLLACLFILAVVAGMTGMAMAYFYAKPRMELAETFDLGEIDNLEVASLILDRRGEEIGRIFVQNRQPISISEVSPNFIQALLAAEDTRFYAHDGVDYVGVLRAVWLNFKAGDVTQGASTITQQLARNTFNLTERTVSRKVTEAFVARRIEREFRDKDKILEAYVNRIYFGSGYYGISAAAKGYFNKEAKDLTVTESATLAGVIRNPYYRSPYHFPEASLRTRNYVIRRMHEERMIDKRQMEAFRAEELKTVPRVSAFGRSKYVYEKVRQQVIELIGYERASEGGFVIHTSIDNAVQLAAEESLTARLDEIEKQPGYSHQLLQDYKEEKRKFLDDAGEGDQPPPPAYLQGAALMIDNRTGGIIALVGGRDFNDSMYDRTSQARRPPGTAFKPFVYAAAFESGLHPGSVVEDTPMDARQVQLGGLEGILGEWGTEDESVYEGDITLRQALAKSRNAATVRVGTRAGLEKVVDLATRAGIHFEGDTRNFNATLLGKSETSMDELCLAYSAFPNGGIRPAAVHLISRVEDAAGKQIYAPEQLASPERVVDSFTAYQISGCLAEALKTGTGREAYSRDGLGAFPVAGKTGTDHSFADNWFVGFTSEVTCAVWAGFDQPKPIYPLAFSSDTVLPVWTAMMNQAALGFEPLAFTPPSGGEKVEICLVSGQLATDACYQVEKNGESTRQVRSTYVEYLRPGTEVTHVCEIHGGPGAAPRSGPSRGPDRTLTLREEGGALRAQPSLVSDPIIPMSATVVGIDPYQSLAPVLRAQAVAVPVAAETDAEAETASEADPPPLLAIPTSDFVEDLPAAPRPRFGEDALDPEDDAPPVAVPVARPLPLDEVSTPANRVTLPPPPPIRFD